MKKRRKEKIVKNPATNPNSEEDPEKDWDKIIPNDQLSEDEYTGVEFDEAREVPKTNKDEEE